MTAELLSPLPAGIAVPVDHSVPVQRAKAGELLKQMARMMMAHPWLLALTVLPNVITQAVAPIQAWLTQKVLNSITKGEQHFLLADLMPYAPLAVGIFAGLGLLQLFEKVSNRMFDDRLLIDVQRHWFDQRGQGCAGQHVARATNDCKNVVKLFDLAQKEFWVVIVGVPAVLAWQLSLSPTLLPALLFTATLPFTVSLVFGALIQQLSHRSVLLVANVSSAVAQGDKTKLHVEQEKLYGNRVRFEVIKQMSEVIAEFAFWLALALLLVLSWSGVWMLLPDALTAAEIGAFLVNVKLISKPLNALTKMHNKIRESWPSVRRVLRPYEPEGVPAP